MRITTRHPKSKFGHPVILDERERVVDPLWGIDRVMDQLGLDRTAAAKLTGISERVLDHYRKGRVKPSTAFLNVLRDALEDLDQ